jgi:hypothetical protein
MNPVWLPNKANLLRTWSRRGRFRGCEAAGYLLQSRARDGEIARLDFCGRLTRPSLDPIAGLPNEQSIGGDHANHDQHPVLDLEAQNGETLDQKLHRSRPLLGRIGGLATEIYYFCISTMRVGLRPPASVTVWRQRRRLATVVAPEIPQIQGRERSASSLSNSEG